MWLLSFEANLVNIESSYPILRILAWRDRPLVKGNEDAGYEGVLKAESECSVQIKTFVYQSDSSERYEILKGNVSWVQRGGL